MLLWRVEHDNGRVIKIRVTNVLCFVLLVIWGRIGVLEHFNVFKSLNIQIYSMNFHPGRNVI